MKVLKTFPAGHPRGQRPAEEYAAQQRAQGQDAEVVMNLGADEYRVVTGRTPKEK